MGPVQQRETDERRIESGLPDSILDKRIKVQRLLGRNIDVW